MKKLFTLLVATLMATTLMAQMHGALKFAGASTMSVMTTTIESASDTVAFVMNGATSGSITLPTMKGMSTIPSFTIDGVAFSMGANHEVTFADQTFNTKVTVDGQEKEIKGSSLSGSYNMANNSLTLKVVFTYGSMPMALTYNIKSYYIKTVTNAVSVSVGGAFNYENGSVSYQVRRYMDGDVEKVDVMVPTYTLDNTVMGNLTLGTYTIKGLTYDAEKGGYYRDYKNDGLTFHFTAENGGVKTMDADYTFNSAKDNNILVVYNGSQVSSIVNTFQMGAMPFGIVSTLNNATTGIGEVNTDRKATANDGKMYNLRGQQVGNDYKGIVIIGGKKYLKK